MNFPFRKLQNSATNIDMILDIENVKEQKIKIQWGDA